MKLKLKPVYILIIITSLIIYSACRRTDQLREQQNETHNSSSIEERFFNQSRTTDPTEKSLVDFIKRKNEKEKFVEKTVSQIGYPRWDKIVTTASKSKIAGREASDSSLATYYLPFVRDSQSYVNASMIIKTYPSDTTFSYKCDWQYAERQNSLNSYADSAEYYAIFFMVLDKAVFGHTEFEITDTSLFKHNNHKPIRIKLDSLQIGGRGNLLEPIEMCQQATISYQDCPWINGNPPRPCAGDNGSCDNCWRCISSVTWTYCWTEWVETGGGGGGTGGTGGNGGGSGSGGGSTPPDNPCGGSTTPFAGRTNLVDPCTGGWNPIPIEDEPGILLPPYVLNNLTKPCLKTALNKLSGGTTNTFFKQIYNTFDTSTIHHLLINESDLTSDSAYGLAYSPVVLPSAGISFTITMDTVKLMNCSQEWIAYVIVHEVAHAAMFANIVQWDTANAQHYAMAGQFLALMANSLMSAYPSLPEFDAYAMCFAGFYNGIEGNPTMEDIAFSLLVRKKISQRFSVSYTNQQIADIGRQYTESGTKGLRDSCN